MLFALSPEMVLGLICAAGLVATGNPWWGAAFLVAFVAYNVLDVLAGLYMGRGGDDGMPPTAGA